MIALVATSFPRQRLLFRVSEPQHQPGCHSGSRSVIVATDSHITACSAAGLQLLVQSCIPELWRLGSKLHVLQQLHVPRRGAGLYLQHAARSIDVACVINYTRTQQWASPSRPMSWPWCKVCRATGRTFSPQGTPMALDLSVRTHSTHAPPHCRMLRSVARVLRCDR